MVKFRIPAVVTCGALMSWKNEYNAHVELTFDGCYVTTSHQDLKFEIINLGGTKVKN